MEFLFAEILSNFYLKYRMITIKIVESKLCKRETYIPNNVNFGHSTGEITKFCLIKKLKIETKNDTFHILRIALIVTLSDHAILNHCRLHLDC